MIETRESEHKGVTFKDFILPVVSSGVCCVNNERFTITDKPRFVITKGSWKFGEELQIKISVPKGLSKKDIRNDYSNWDSLEIAMPLSEAKKLIHSLALELNIL